MRLSLLLLMLLGCCHLLLRCSLLLLRCHGGLGELQLVGDLQGELGELPAAVVNVLAVEAEGGGRLADVVA